MFPRFFLTRKRYDRFVATKAGPAKHPGITGQETVASRFRPWRRTCHSFLSIYGYQGC
ncbi:hypothetical protein [Aneurinibacillus aneurinilyticus]|uniref:hypothetical protein n=1 Tax=Aneurinibacillus aneurinilyticus TaxID=1391 RepID=UPI003526342E